MKVLPFNIPKAKVNRILFQNDRNKIPYSHLHQHTEFQITLVEQGKGSMIIGDSFHRFSSGDVFLFGSNLPHAFTSEKECSMVSIFFTPESLGPDFFSLPDLNPIKDLLLKANKGLRLSAESHRTKELISLFELSKGPLRVISFLQLLQVISEHQHVTLSVFSYEKQFSHNEGKRMMNVFNYVMENYQNDIRLEQISTVAMLSRNSFCKYFKQRTNKTFFQFLSEVRIEKACELLINNPPFSIYDITSMIGFKNQSNFNRQFFKIKGVSPSSFRKSILIN